MKRTNSRIIKLPSIVEAGGELAVGLDTEEVEELNARSYDYSKRTANPTLDDYVIEPFSTTFKERVFTEAVREVGLDSEGILNGSYTYRETFDKRVFVARAYPQDRTQFEIVLANVRSFLDTVQADSAQSREREGIIVENSNPLISIDYLTTEMSRVKASPNLSSRINVRDLVVNDPDTNKAFWDEEIEQMLVYLDLQRLTRVNKRNASDFHAGSSLRQRIRTFQNDFTKSLMQRYGVAVADLSKPLPYDYELSDGSAIRYLFSASESTEYGQVFSGLLGQTTKRIAGSSGDLTILKELAFKDDYESRAGGHLFSVSTETKDDSVAGITTIRRKPREGVERVQTYHVKQTEGLIYVLVPDVVNTMGALLQHHHNVSPRLKIDLFAAPPTYLR